MWSIGGFVLHCWECWEEIVYCRCDGNRDGSAISDKNWIKNRKAAASRVTEPRLYWQMNQRMNEQQSLHFTLLLFASLSFLDFFFPSGLLLRKNPSARLCMVSFHSMLALKFQGTWIWKKKDSKRILTFRISSSNLFVCQSTQRRISGATPFFAKHTYTFWSSSWSSTVKIPFIFIDLCRFSRADVPPSGPENVPKPRLPPYESPLSAVSSTCKEITWDKCYGSVRLALFTASLSKKCVVWNRTN